MRRMVRWGVVMAAAALAVAPAAGRAERGPRVGQPAPEITGGTWLDGDALTLAGLRGRVVLIEFWTYG